MKYLRNSYSKIINKVKANPEFVELCDDLKYHRGPWDEVKQLIDRIYTEFNVERVTPAEKEKLSWILFGLKWTECYIQAFDLSRQSFEEMSPGLYADFILYMGYKRTQELVASLRVEAAL